MSSTADIHDYGPESQSSMVAPRRLNYLKLISTFILLVSLALAPFLSLGAVNAEQIFRNTSLVVFVGLILALGIEATAGVRNLIRVDLFMLSVLFLLTFFEFLLPQENISNLITMEAATNAIDATLIGFAGLTIGRHAFRARRPMPRNVNFQASPRLTVTLLLTSAFLGYLYMLIAVRFDITELIYQMTKPRFTQPWTRGRLGSISTLLNEFGLLKYLIAPLSAAILAQRKHYKKWHLTVALLLLALLIFESFAGGTRYVLLTHLITFAVTFALLIPKLKLRKIIFLISPLLAVIYFSVLYLPEIRKIGLQNFDLATSQTQTLFVDMNLVNIALLTDVFPDYQQFLLLEIPFIAAVRPIPRAVWPGKPEGLTVGIEEALGVSNRTLSATFVGELWMSGGYWAVLFGALIFGALGAAWNRKAAVARTNIDIIYFAVGLFPAGLCMRSFMSVFPALLPILALAIYLKFKRM
jgi:oligosaccharide repeat unit polymerase